MGAGGWSENHAQTRSGAAAAEEEIVVEPEVSEVGLMEVTEAEASSIDGSLRCDIAELWEVPDPEVFFRDYLRQVIDIFPFLLPPHLSLY